MSDIYAAAEDVALNPEQQIVREASDRWKACKEFQGVEDERTREDIKFANGDARNSWQWPTKIYDERTAGESNLPCLTINNTRVHNDLIINAICKNGYSVKIRPTGGKASYKSAEVMEGLVRHIQNTSRYAEQKRKVVEQQVDGGIGYILIETQYVSNKTRDQDIFLKASRDPTAVYLDPWIRQPDGLDANFGFIFERLPRKEFNRKYPQWKDKVGVAPVDSAFSDWLSEKEVLLAKYFRKKQKKDTFVWYEMEDGTGIEKLASEIRDESGPDIYKQLIEDIRSKKILGGTRPVYNDEVEWFLIAGDTIVDKGDWAGKYIPICRCVGRELIIDNTLDRKGMTRSLIDPNRMLNYSASVGVELVALQPKAPFIAPARALEGQEQWKTMNIHGFPVILYNDVDEDAPSPQTQTIAPPQRIEPPRSAEGYTTQMAAAERWGMMVSGQFQAQMGENEPQAASSGKAINERQEQGETATYHFNEHAADMDRAVGVQLLDLIPKIYDNRRTRHILDKDNERRWIQIEPDQEDAVIELQHEQEDEEAIQFAFNPNVGEYECVSDPGPSYATQRQEAWNAMSIVLQQNMELAAVIGDLLFKYGDFPGADEIMERLQKEIKATKPYLFDKNQDPSVLALQAQGQKLAALNGELVQKIAEMQLKLRGKEELRDIEAYKAESERIGRVATATKDLHGLPGSQEALIAVLHDVVGEAIKTHLTGLVQANQPEVEDQPDKQASGATQTGAGGSNGGTNQELPPNARQAPDGQYYVPDAGRPGKYMRVVSGNAA